MIEELEKWEKATEELTKKFVEKYFPNYYYKEDCFWVADDIGGVFCIVSDFFGLDRIVEALKYNATQEQLFEYYYLEIEHKMSKDCDKPMPVNFKTFVRTGAKP